jgi:tRNA(Ile)-lysidine synthase
MLARLQSDLRRRRLLRAGERVGLAVSGGADSVALLCAFAALAPELGLVLRVLHLNHRLRGADSDADANFVASLAAELSIEAVLESADVAALAAAEHISVEAAGRRARYAFFLRAAAGHRLDSVATAHTRDDQAETVLLRLLRGAGPSGLAGIHRACDLVSLVHAPLPAELRVATVAQHEGTVSPRLIRPLLSFSRAEVEQYLGEIGQGFRHDTSNLDPRYLRNRVRTQLLPALEREYNPQLRQALSETAEIAADENAWIEELVSALAGPVSVTGTAPQSAEAAAAEQGIELPLFRAQPVALQRRILRRLCQPHALALDFAQLEALRDFALAGRAGSLQLPVGCSAEIVRPRLGAARLRLLAPSGR